MISPTRSEKQFIKIPFNLEDAKNLVGICQIWTRRGNALTDSFLSFQGIVLDKYKEKHFSEVMLGIVLVSKTMGFRSSVFPDRFLPISGLHLSPNFCHSWILVPVHPLWISIWFCDSNHAYLLLFGTWSHFMLCRLSVLGEAIGSTLLSRSDCWVVQKDWETQKWFI